MRTATLVFCCLAIMILVINCSDKGTEPGALVYEGITGTDALGVLTSYDPDDWCYGDIISTDELVYFAPVIAIGGMEYGSDGIAWVNLFNYSAKDVTIQLGSTDSTLSFQQRSVTIPAQSWGGFRVDYHAYDDDVHAGELVLPVEPDGETLVMPFTTIDNMILAPDVIIMTKTFTQAYPNPFMHDITFRFTLDQQDHVKLVVRGPGSDLTIAETVIDEVRYAGWHEVVWSPRMQTRPGIYRAYITIGDDFQCYGDIELVEDPIGWKPN